MTLAEHEAAVAAANAKVAEAVAAWLASKGVDFGKNDALVLAHQERTACLAALAAARRPQLMTAEEAARMLRSAPPETKFMTDMQAVLTADRERCVKVIEALKGVWETADGRKHAPIGEIRTALLGAGSKG